MNHSTKGTETVNAINNLALITGQHRPRRAPRRFRSPASATPWARAKPGFASSLPGLPQVRERSRPRGAGRDLERAGRSHSRPRAAWPIRTSSKRRSTRKIRALWIIAHQSDRVVPQSRRARAGARATSSSSSCRTAFIRRPRPSSRTSCCRPRSGARRKAPTRTPSGASARCNRAVDPPGEARVRLRHLSRPRRATRCAARSCFRAGRRPRTPSRSGSACRPAGSATTPGMTYEAIEAHGGIQWPFPAGAADPARDAPSLHGRRVSDRRRPGAAASDEVGAVSRAAQRRVSVRAQHRPHGRALAHAHEDRPGADPRAPVAERVGRDEPARCARAAPQAAGPRGRRLARGARFAASSCASPRRSRPGRSSCRSTTRRPTRTR